MKGKLIISSFDEEETEFHTGVSRGIHPYDYEISIRTSLEGIFEDIISKPYDFDESIDLALNAVSKDEDVEFFKQIKSNRLQYIKNADDIIFNYKPKEVAEFVKRNPILKTKRIIFEDYFNLDSKLVNEVSEAFGEDTSNIYFQISGNDNLITFKEYEDTVETINQKINEIGKFNFSPLEKIMYIYDMVRDKIYLEVDENEDKMISRDLTSALLGDKIVCVGYAKIFETLVEKMGIECECVFLDHLYKNEGHARNVIFVKDNKYGIEGIYYFDPTWDNKKYEFDKDFLYSYKYFAMTKEKIDEIDNGCIVDRDFPYFSKDIVSEFEEQVDKVGFEGLSDEMVKSINNISRLTKGGINLNKKLIKMLPPILRPDKKTIIEKLSKLIEYFDRPISADILLKVLYNVRKQQYYANPEKYPFGLNEFYKTVFISGWNFDGTPQENLILGIASTSKEREKIKVKQTVRYARETDMYKHIQQVKLAKTLRRVYEQKTMK